MKITISQARNAVAGWNVSVSVQVEAGESIGHVEVRVNDVLEIQDLPGDVVDVWTQHLTQRGVYPGHNKVDVTVTSKDWEETHAEQEWS